MAKVESRGSRARSGVSRTRPNFERHFNRSMTKPGSFPGENASTEMTALIELDSNNGASLQSLFDCYPCLHGVVAAIIEGGMGRVFADAREEPQVALAVLDFHLLAGNLPSDPIMLLSATSPSTG